MSDACIPPDPTKAGAHWLKNERWDCPVSMDWNPVQKEWSVATPACCGRLSVRYMTNDGWHYIRPVLTPDQEDALHAEIDEMAAALNDVSRDLLAAYEEIGTLRADRERLRAALTEATTARDDAAGDAMEREWRAM